MIPTQVGGTSRRTRTTGPEARPSTIDGTGYESDRSGGTATAKQEHATSGLDNPSMGDLVEAYREPGRPAFAEVRLSFEREHGKIVEYFFARNVVAGAVLVRRPHRLRPFGRVYAIMVSHDGGSVPPALGEQLRTVLREERQQVIHVQGRARQILVQNAYSLIVYLLTAFDCASTEPDSKALAATVGATVESARRDLDEQRKFAKAAARRTALWYYLMGLPLGAVTGIGLIVGAYQSKTVDILADRMVVATCLAAGAVGAVISVMVRITRGTTLDVDSDRGRGVTLLAGSFRPVIGAVFGGVLLVLILGGLLPFQIPAVDSLSISAAERSSFFFIGLSFLAGFSERWAQDTIVNSAPKVPAAPRSESRTPHDSEFS